MRDLILGVDQGTTSTRACVLDREGRSLSRGRLPHGQIYPREGWVEHDPDEIWECVRRAILRCVEDAGAGFEIVDRVTWEDRNSTLTHDQTLKRRSLVRGEHSKVHGLSGLSESCHGDEPIGGGELDAVIVRTEVLDVVEADLPISPRRARIAA